MFACPHVALCEILIDIDFAVVKIFEELECSKQPDNSFVVSHLQISRSWKLVKQIEVFKLLKDLYDVWSISHGGYL